MSVVAGALAATYEVTVITGLQQGKPLFYPLDGRVKYVDLGVHPGDGRRHWFHNPVMADYRRKLTAYLQANAQDFVVSLGGITQYFLPELNDGSKKLLWFKFEINIFKIWAQSISNPLRRAIEVPFQKWRMIRAARRFDRIIVLTDHDQQEWSRYTARAQRIYNPLTIDHVSLSDCTPHRVIAVGRLDYVKGFDLLIRAWKQVNDKYPDWQLTIWGEGKDRQQLEQLRNSLGLQTVVSMPGRTKDVVSQYGRSSIFVLSSREEGFGNVMTEAEACGLPILAFDCPYGPREVVADGRNGYLVPLGDVDGMARRLIQLIGDEPLRQQLGRESLEVVKRFDLKAITGEWMQCLNSLPQPLR